MRYQPAWRAARYSSKTSTLFGSTIAIESPTSRPSWRRPCTSWFAAPSSSPAGISAPSGPTTARWSGSSWAMLQNPRSAIDPPSLWSTSGPQTRTDSNNLDRRGEEQEATHMGQPVIVEAVRTPIGKRNGVLSGVQAGDILAPAQVEGIKRAGVDPADLGQGRGGFGTH